MNTNTSRNDMGLTMVIVALAVAAVITIVGGAFWLTRDQESEKFGDCAGTAHQLSVESEDGNLEASFELQANQPGEDWYVRLMQDGDVLVEGPRTTDEDGEIEVDAYAKDNDGSDEFTVEFSRADFEDNCSVSLSH